LSILANEFLIRFWSCWAVHVARISWPVRVDWILWYSVQSHTREQIGSTSV